MEPKNPSTQSDQGEFDRLTALAAFSESQTEYRESRRKLLFLFWPAEIAAVVFSVVYFVFRFTQNQELSDAYFVCWGIRWLTFGLWAVFIPNSFRSAGATSDGLPLFAKAERGGVFWQFAALISPPIAALLLLLAIGR